MSRRSWLPLAVVLLVMCCASVAHADDIMQVGGRYRNARNGDFVNSSGHAQAVQMNRPNDDNTIVNLLGAKSLWVDSLAAPSGGTLVSSVMTSFVDVSIFNRGFLHLTWTDSLGTGASTDSLAFEVFVVGKMSLTTDGFDYYTDTDPSGAVTDTLLDGYFVTSPRNPWAQINPSGTQALKRSSIVYYTKRPDPASALTLTGIQTYSVMIPLVNKQGVSLLENMMGFLIHNRQKNKIIFGSAGANGVVCTYNTLHNLTVDIVLKAN
jgi:hypothetical protein